MSSSDPMPRGAWVAALVLALTCSLGCEASSAERPLRVGLVVWPPYELAYLASDLGHLDQRQVQLVDYRSPAELMRAYRYGLVDAAALTSNYFLQLRQHDESHRIAMVLDVSHGGDVLLARPGIEQIEELAGKRVGVEAGALGAHVLLRCLGLGGVERDAVTIVPIDVPDHTRAFLDGRVDAVVTYEPTRSMLLDGGAEELCSSRDLPGEVVDVLIVREGTLDERLEAFRHLATAWFQARRWYTGHPLAAARRVAPREGLSPEAFVAALELVTLPDRHENAELLGGDSPRLRPSLETLQRFLLGAGELQQASELDGAFDPRALEAP